MKMKCIAALCLVVCSFAVACGDDGDDGKSSGSSKKVSAAEYAAGACDEDMAMSESGNDCSAYTECVPTKCGAEYRECLGAKYESGDFSGGACEAFMTCALESDDPCENDCMLDAACTSCFSKIGACALNNCSAELQECSGTSSPAPSGSVDFGSGTCEDLEACCASLSGEQKTNCDTQYDSVQAAGDLGCSAALSIYQASGTCQ